jgi:hypothetical protein
MKTSVRNILVQVDQRELALTLRRVDDDAYTQTLVYDTTTKAMVGEIFASRGHISAARAEGTMHEFQYTGLCYDCRTEAEAFEVLCKSIQ